MTVGCLIVCWSLLSQQAVPRSDVPATSHEPATAGPLVPVDPRKPKLSPPKLVADSLAPLGQEPLIGRPLPLMEVLTRSALRPRQLAAVQAYWALAAAVGEYNFSRQERDALTALVAAAGARKQADRLESSALAAEMALASARVQEALLRVAAAQVDLAEKAGLPVGDRTPLPADEPHVGLYRTYFDVLFASRIAPPRLHLLERTLPLRRKAIDVRAEAVQAASDAVAAAQDALGRKEIEPESVALRLALLSRQRKAFLDDVRQYNQDIAEYALAVADANAPPASVLTMLIKPREAPAPSPAERTSPAGTPTEATESAGTPRTGSNPNAMRSLLKSNPTTDAEAQTRLKPQADELAQLAPVDSEQPDHESYAALLTMSAPKRTHRLARLLHWDRSLGESAEPALSLEQYLALVQPADRRRAVEVYWLAREQAARCQVASDQIDQLAALYPLVLQAVRRPGGAEAMLDLRAWQQAAQADLLENQMLLWARRMDLATLLGRAGNPKDWPMPATPPHGGRYETKLDSQPQTLAHSVALQHLATTVPGLYAALEDRAEAIIRLDGQRGLPIGVFEKERYADLWDALALIDRQAVESQAFLSTLTRYNSSIADYALAILPPTISPVELTASLVVQAK